MSDFDELVRDMQQPEAPRREHLRAQRPQPKAQPAGELAEYKAFDTADRVARIDLRGAMTFDKTTRSMVYMAFALPYSHLLIVAYDDEGYGSILLQLSGVVAQISGRNLRKIVDALKLHSCEFIQAFRPKKFAQPDDGDPFVESILVKLIGGKSDDEAPAAKKPAETERRS
jgi:hypothetical protein